MPPPTTVSDIDFLESCPDTLLFASWDWDGPASSRIVAGALSPVRRRGSLAFALAFDECRTVKVLGGRASFCFLTCRLASNPAWMSGEMCALGGNGGGGLSRPPIVGRGGSGGERTSSMLFIDLAEKPEVPGRPAVAARDGSAADETGLGKPGVATMGVGLTSFGFDCLKGFGAGSKPCSGSPTFSDVDREWPPASLNGFGDRAGLVDSGGTGGARTDAMAGAGREAAAGVAGGCV